MRAESRFVRPSDNYGYRALRIVQTQVESTLIKDLDSYKNVEAIHVGDAVGQYGISPAQKTIWESATPPVFTTNNSYSLLLWEKDGMVDQIYFDQSFSGGGYLTKDQMIQIAESLRSCKIGAALGRAALSILPFS